jgi:glycosyltransferase involved in cell wall biosynthesis
MMLFYIISFTLAVFLTISAYNFFTAPEIKGSGSGIEHKKLISILIPARNEERNIENCLRSVLEQDYPNKEIIVLDDFSSDKTFSIASGFAQQNVKVVKGKELPAGWVGKNWACHQLANEATSDFLLFLDADVNLKPQAISAAYNDLQKSNAIMLSVFPTQIFRNFGVYLVVPLMNWILLTFLPLKFVYSFSQKSFVAANGQFMLWRKEAYNKVGGHKKVYNKIVEDMELARECKSQKLKIKTLIGGDLIFCKMYNSFSEAISGYQKNFYPGFDSKPVIFLIIISFLFLVFLAPYFLVSQSLLYLIPLAMILLSRVFVSLKSKQNFLFNVILHPLQIIIMFFVGINSVIKSELHTIEWKERKI